MTMLCKCRIMPGQKHEQGAQRDAPCYYCVVSEGAPMPAPTRACACEQGCGAAVGLEACAINSMGARQPPRCRTPCFTTIMRSDCVSELPQRRYSTPHAFSNALHTLLHTTAPLRGYSLTLIASSV